MDRLQFFGTFLPCQRLLGADWKQPGDFIKDEMEIAN